MKSLNGAAVVVSSLTIALSLSEIAMSALFTTYTASNGLGSSTVYDVFVGNGSIYAATFGGLSKSTDGGQSWINHSLDDGWGGSAVGGVAASNGKVFAACFRGGLSVSLDGGTSWSTQTFSTPYSPDPVSIEKVYAVGDTVCLATDSGVFLSADHGATWTHAVDGLPSNFFFSAAIANGKIYCGSTAGLSVSSDFGASWTTHRASTGFGIYEVDVQDIAVDGTSIYAATQWGLNVSHDGGNSWNNLLFGPMALDNDIASVSILDGLVCVGGIGKLHISADGGLTWTTYSSPEGISGRVWGVLLSGDSVYAATSSGLSVMTLVSVPGVGLSGPACVIAVAATARGRRSRRVHSRER